MADSGQKRKICSGTEFNFAKNLGMDDKSINPPSKKKKMSTHSGTPKTISKPIASSSSKHSTNSHPSKKSEERKNHKEKSPEKGQSDPKITKDCSYYKDKLRKSEKECKYLKKDLTTLKDKITKQEESIKEQDNKISRQDEAINSRNDIIKIRNETIDTLQKDLVKDKKQTDEMMKENEEFEARMENVVKQKDDTIKKLTTEKETLTEQKDKIETELIALNKNIKTLEQKCKDLKSEKDKHEETKKSLSKTEISIENMRKELEELRPAKCDTQTQTESGASDENISKTDVASMFQEILKTCNERTDVCQLKEELRTKEHLTKKLQDDLRNKSYNSDRYRMERDKVTKERDEVLKTLGDTIKMYEQHTKIIVDKLTTIDAKIINPEEQSDDKKGLAELKKAINENNYVQKIFGELEKKMDDINSNCSKLGEQFNTTDSVINSFISGFGGLNMSTLKSELDDTIKKIIASGIHYQDSKYNDMVHKLLTVEGTVRATHENVIKAILTIPSKMVELNELRVCDMMLEGNATMGTDGSTVSHGHPPQLLPHPSFPQLQARMHPQQIPPQAHMTPIHTRAPSMNGRGSQVVGGMINVIGPQVSQANTNGYISGGLIRGVNLPHPR